MKTNDKLRLLKKMPLFSTLPESDLVRLTELMQDHILPRYSYVYEHGQPAQQVFLLAQGSLKIANHNAEGKEVIKQLIHPEAIFGERTLLGEKTRQDSAQSLREPVHYCAIDALEFRKLMQQNPCLNEEILQLFGQRLLVAEQMLENVIFKDARSRIIDFLREVVQQRGHPVGYEMLLKHSLTHQDIANITCTSRQTVTLVFNELKRDNLIHFNRGRILVRDLQQLEASA
ncbi:MAG: Crp/Fnr family transcriptional regulator [Lewinella sp.]|nr:Crp/Fnr family transcriptional regulator [Lewinella sp.]